MHPLGRSVTQAGVSACLPPQPARTTKTPAKVVRRTECSGIANLAPQGGRFLAVPQASLVALRRAGFLALGRRDVADAALLVEETVGADAVASQVDGDVGLARFGAVAGRRVGQPNRGIDPGLARRSAESEALAGVDQLGELLPASAAGAVGLVDPKLLLHVAGR